MTTPETPPDTEPRPHWHPKNSHTIADDGRIHALAGYRIHVDPIRRNLRDTRRLCDETTCDACIHDCQCFDCSGWCRCDTPPESTAYLPPTPSE
ncbi:hypothetical protein [Nocardia sp. alder85J]|uniref:hypothetical protein n=1 Tax=Nocardia sp. alder85J TaxID=2862949 RepID=UPI001CD65F4A|nr:hypothetical protein [Nocardia sp. alder85J]MCX4099115.1 hypothetical protein [Nocardia sp. alder85J]